MDKEGVQSFMYTRFKHFFFSHFHIFYPRAKGLLIKTFIQNKNLLVSCPFWELNNIIINIFSAITMFLHNIEAISYTFVNFISTYSSWDVYYTFLKFWILMTWHDHEWMTLISTKTKGYFSFIIIKKNTGMSSWDIMFRNFSSLSPV